MGNNINITRFEFAGTKPWLLDEEATVGKEQIPIAVFSVRAGIMSYFNVFVQRGFSFKYVDEFGNTPLHYAAEKNHDYVSALLENGLSPSRYNLRGQTPLMIAVKNGRYQHVKALLSVWYIRDYKCNAPIHYAIEADDVKMVMLLLSNTPKLPSTWILTNYKATEYHMHCLLNSESISAFCMAVLKLKYEAVQCFMSLGADPDLEINGVSAKSILAKMGTRNTYGDIFYSKHCTKKEIDKMWSILSRDMDVNRNIGGDLHTRLLG
tara:strand:- start:3995 stop:4789 length:795 start_codon:yes stop_codon:yes gene_type:complete